MYFVFQLHFYCNLYLKYSSAQTSYTHFPRHYLNTWQKETDFRTRALMLSCCQKPMHVFSHSDANWIDWHFETQFCSTGYFKFIFLTNFVFWRVVSWQKLKSNLYFNCFPKLFLPPENGCETDLFALLPMCRWPSSWIVQSRCSTADEYLSWRETSASDGCLFTGS